MMDETAGALRATSDTLLQDLETLASIEEEKRTIEPGDPRLVELAGQVEEIARRVLDGSRRQRVLTETANSQVEAGDPAAPTTSIEATPRPIAVILAEWREAERRAVAAEPGTAEASAADDLVEQCRAEYRRARDAAERR
jgi:hypothetical protein